MPVRQGTMTGKDTTLARSQHMKRKVKLKQQSKSHAGNKGQLQKKYILMCLAAVRKKAATLNNIQHKIYNTKKRSH